MQAYSVTVPLLCFRASRHVHVLQADIAKAFLNHMEALVASPIQCLRLVDTTSDSQRSVPLKHRLPILYECELNPREDKVYYRYRESPTWFSP